MAIDIAPPNLQQIPPERSDAPGRQIDAPLQQAVAPQDDATNQRPEAVQQPEPLNLLSVVERGGHLPAREQIEKCIPDFMGLRSLLCRGYEAVKTAAENEIFINRMQRDHLEYFLKNVHPVTGLTLDRSTPHSPSSVAAVGFGLTSMAVGAERGWITREDAADRVHKTLTTLWNAPQGEGGNCAGYKGFFYHFIDPVTTARANKCELSTVDTALLMAGVLFAGDYFKGDTPKEREIRELSDKLYRRVEWDWAARDSERLTMGWTPENGFLTSEWHGYNEAMLLLVLGIGSPTHPLKDRPADASKPANAPVETPRVSPPTPAPVEASRPDAQAQTAPRTTSGAVGQADAQEGRSDRGTSVASNSYWRAYTSSYQVNRSYNQEHVVFGPLFGHQFSHAWIDFRGIKDDATSKLGFDYFENSRRATIVQHEYAKDNPNRWRDYNARTWGITASDGPGLILRDYNGRPVQFHGYRARGFPHEFDDGTIAPTAVASSLPFYPEGVLPTLRDWRQRRPEIYGPHGFQDAFNPSFDTTKPSGWVAPDTIGIDQGPIVLMAENYRSGLVWNVMRSNPYIQAGLRGAGFRGGWLDQAQRPKS